MAQDRESREGREEWDESRITDEFEREVGSIAKCYRLMDLYARSSLYVRPGLRPGSLQAEVERLQRFRETAHREGYSERAVELFLRLQ